MSPIHSGFSSLGTLSVNSSIQIIGQGQGQPSGILSEHSSAGNYEIRNLGTGTFTVGNDGGLLIMHSASSGSIAFQIGSGNNRVILQNTGVVDMTRAALSVRTTASSASASNLTQGELCLVAVSTTSAQLAFRSGNTVYVFNAAQASP